MANTSRHGVVRNDRASLGARGLVRFEVVGKSADRELIRSVAKRLAEGGPSASSLRRTLGEAIADEPVAPTKGRIYEAFRRSPLVGSGIDLSKTRHPGRDVDL